MLLALGVGVASLICFDFAHRVWRWHRELPHTGAAIRATIERKLSATRSFVPKGPAEIRRPRELASAVLHPFAGGESWHDTGGVLEHFRNAARPEDFELLVMGGSVAAAFGEHLIANVPDEWSAAARAAGRRLVVLNYAHAAYKQPQQVGRLSYLFALGCEPEAVLEIDGFNELALGYENACDGGVHPVYPSAPVWGGLLPSSSVDPLRYAQLVGRMIVSRERVFEAYEFATRWHFTSSSLASLWIERRVERHLRENAELRQALADLPSTPPSAEDRERQRERSGPEFARQEDAVLAVCVGAWEQGSISMNALCAARGVRYLHFLQPTLHDEGSKVWSAAEERLAPPSSSWLFAARHGYPLLRERGAELSATGIAYFDHSRVFADVAETVYYDPCHILEHGNQLWLEACSEPLGKALFSP